VAKLVAKAQKYAKDEMIFEQDYKESIMKLASFQPSWEEKLSQLYQVLQQQEEERLEYIKTSLDKFVLALEVGAPYMVEACKRMKVVVRAIDRKEDIMCFIRENQTGSEKQQVPPFVPYHKTNGGTSVSSYSSPASSSPSLVSASKISGGSGIFSQVGAGGGVSNVKKPTSSKPGKKVRALYDYVGADANELDFFANDIIEVLEEDGSGWWTGQIEGRRGLFPSNYVEQF